MPVSAESPASEKPSQPLSAPPPEPSPETAASEQLKVIIEDYQRAIAEQEALGGAYDLQLSEQLYSLGGLYQQAGKHAEAEQTYKSALHIARVNNGIYSLSQEPMLRGIITSLQARNKNLEAGEYFNQLNWLHVKAYGQDNPKLLPIMAETALWHLTVYNQSKKTRNDVVHLSAAHELFTAAINLAKRHPQNQPPTLPELLRASASTSYQLALHYTRYQSLPEEDLFARQRWIAYEPADTDGSLRYNYYKYGRNAHAEIVSMASIHSEDPRTQALSYAELGDWYLLFGRKQSASESYQQAFALASSNEQNEQLVKEIFYRPVILPAFQPVPEKSYPESTPWAEIEMDINLKGKPYNINVVAHSKNTDQAMVEKYARTNVKSLIFRPRYENGVAVIAKAVPLKIAMPDFWSKQ